jgi:cell wall-associated NlpC family hydrolase
VASVVLLSSGVVFTLPAAATPQASATPTATPGGSGGGSGTQPSTSEQAKQAWLDAADKAEVASEDLLNAQAAEKAAKKTAALAEVGVAGTQLAAGIAQAKSVRAAAQLSSYEQQLDSFASASFRGGRLGQLTALLSAGSSTDYLDEVSSLDQIAGHTRALMASAITAKRSAAAAAAAATTAAATAVDAKVKADAAVAKAVAATQTVTERKTKLDAQVATYHTLFDSLSAKERQQAMDAQQAAWEKQTQEAAAAAAAQAADAAASSSSAAAAAAAGAAAARDQRAPATVDGSSTSSATSPSTTSSSKSSPSTSSSSAPKAAPAVRTKAQIAVNAALTKLGYRYVYGAAGPNAFDCSGLTSWAWAQAGVSIPHSSYAQSQYPYVPLSQLQPGDLVTYYSPVHHVALYIGNGQIIDASTESKPIFITSVYRGGPDPTGHRVNY